MTTIYDISPPLSERTSVWPGDIPLSRQVQMRLESGDSVTLSSLITTVHIGAHADAPSHYHKDGQTIDQVDLAPYLGPCTVLSCQTRGLIRPEDCEPALRLKARRLLFRTLSHPDPERFMPEFTSFSVEAIRAMGEAGVVLIGIDTPSIDPVDSQTLPSHHEILRYDMRNLEGLDLAAVPDGNYELIALPLKLVGFDASPVRAILRSL